MSERRRTGAGSESEASEDTGASAIPAPDPSSVVEPDPDILRAGGRWVREQQAVSVPVLAALLGAFVLFLLDLFGQGLRAGQAEVYQVPAEWAPSSPQMGAVLSILVLLFIVPAVGGVLLFTDMLTHRGARTWAFLLYLAATVAPAVLVPSRREWLLTASWAGVLMALWVALELIATAGRYLSRVQPSSERPRWIPHRPFGGLWDWLASPRVLRAFIVPAMALTVVLACLIATASAAAWAGRRVGESWLDPDSADVWVLEGPRSPAADEVMVLFDGDRLLERPLDRLSGRTYRPCGTITIRPLSDAGVSLRRVQDLDLVAEGRATRRPCPGR